MKAQIVDLDNKKQGELSLSEDIFGQEIKKNILARVINWQLAKRQQGTHKIKSVGDVSARKGKPFKQKGTGNARQGTRVAVQMRGGGNAFAKGVRDYSYSLPKKIRKLALKVALSSKLASKKLIILKDVDIKDGKTSALRKKVDNFKFDGSVLIIDSNDLNEKFKLASANLKNLDYLPCCGANVYDIIRRKNLVLTQEAVKGLEERLA